MNLVWKAELLLDLFHYLLRFIFKRFLCSRQNKYTVRKNALSPHVRVKIANQIFYIGSGAYVIQNLKFVVEGILGCIILILRRHMGTYNANVKIFCLIADGG